MPQIVHTFRFTSAFFKHRHKSVKTMQNVESGPKNLIEIMKFKMKSRDKKRWSLIRDTLGVENEEKNNLSFANKVFDR